MKLIILAVLLSYGAAFEGLCIQAVKVQEECSVTRKKRALDEEDVINRFEMERVSPLYDIIKHFPPFEDDWIPPAFTNIPTPPNFLTPQIPPTFKLDVSKDGHHVISESGRRHSPHSALSWWYSVHSYSNVSEYNYTKTEPILSNRIEFKTPSSRSLDEDHVFSKVPGLRNGRESSIDEVFLKVATTPTMTATLPPEIKNSKPNITTRYILLQSGRIVAINVTSAPEHKSATLPPNYFGSRIRNKNLTSSSNVKPENKTLNAPRTFSGRTIFVNNTISNLRSQPKNNVSAIVNLNTGNGTLNVSRILPGRTIFIGNAVSNFKPPSNPGERRTGNIVEIMTITNTSNKVTTVSPPWKQSSTSSSVDLRTTQILNTHFPKLINSFTVSKTTVSPLVTETQTAFKNVKPTISFEERNPATVKPLPTKTTPPPTTEYRHPISISTTRFGSYPPKNIIETIFNVLNPKTSTAPFLVVTFDSSKNNIPGITESYKIVPQTASNRISNRNKPKYFTSVVEYEKETSQKPKILQYGSITFRRTFLSNPSSAIMNNKETSTSNRNWGDQRLRTNLTPEISNSTETANKFTRENNRNLPKMRHEFARISSLHPTTPSTQNLSTTYRNTDAQSTRPRYRGISHITQIFPRNHRTLSTTTTSLMDSTSSQINNPTSTRRSRQNSFHLRNSVGFQTIPPTALSDRRFYSASTRAPESFIPPEPPLSRMRMEEVLALRFEPTRRSSSLNLQHKTPHSSDSTSSKALTSSTTRTRFSTVRTPRISSTFAPRTTKPTTVLTNTSLRPNRRLDFVPVAKPSVKPTSYPTTTRNSYRNERNFRILTSEPKSIAEHSNSSTTTTTPKPFKVYFFEPKRRSRKKIEEIPEKVKEVERNQFQTENIREARNFQLRPDQPNNISPRNRNLVTESRFIFAGRSLITTPKPIVTNVGRRVTNRFTPAHQVSFTSPSPITTSETTHTKRTKKSWYSPFIRHQPNVRTTTLLSTESRLIEESSSVHETRTRRQPTEDVGVPLPKTFRDFVRLQKLPPV